ncbi:MAG: type II toxin-antitoxin system prevent-host-death family antitoxin [Campylobacteraceae bacterium]|nr:type II toxin-antitoxin system prevent-host-death family antitoxin [Campylobacteraceae bacterium]
MQVMSVGEARRNFKAVIDSVLFNKENIIIHRKEKESVVVISLDEFNAIKETEYLLSNKVNADRLLSAIKRIQDGAGVKREMIK